MTKGHNKGKFKEENFNSKDNTKGQSQHLKKSKQSDSPNQGRSKNEDPAEGRKGNNNV